MNTEYIVSVCCSADVGAETSPDFIGDKPEDMTIGTTNYWCMSCCKPCNTKVKFDEVSVKVFLDEAIRALRLKRQEALLKGAGGDQEDVTMAVHYIDAYQSVRVSLFGELLPDDEEEITIPGPQCQV